MYKLLVVGYKSTCVRALPDQVTVISTNLRHSIPHPYKMGPPVKHFRPEPVPWLKQFHTFNWLLKTFKACFAIYHNTNSLIVQPLQRDKSLIDLRSDW